MSKLLEELLAFRMVRLPRIPELAFKPIAELIPRPFIVEPERSKQIARFKEASDEDLEAIAGLWRGASTLAIPTSSDVERIARLKQVEVCDFGSFCTPGRRSE
jgi:hypothetical protein